MSNLRIPCHILGRIHVFIVHIIGSYQCMYIAHVFPVVVTVIVVNDVNVAGTLVVVNVTRVC